MYENAWKYLNKIYDYFWSQDYACWLRSTEQFCAICLFNGKQLGVFLLFYS